MSNRSRLLAVKPRIPLGIAVIGLAFAGAAAQAEAQVIPDTRSILMRMSVNARCTGYEGRRVVIDLSGELPDITRYRVTHLMPDLEKKEYPDQGMVVLRKDGWLWSYYPKQALVVKKRAPVTEEWDLLQRENLELVMKNYQVRLGHGMAVLGRPSFLVQFDPLERGSRPVRKVWVDADKGIPLRGEVYGTDGTLYQVSHYEAIQFDPRFKADAFELRVPRARVVESDAEVSRCRAPARSSGGAVTQPGTVPGGFVAKCLRKTVSGGAAQYQEIYSDGLSALSFFQGEGEERVASKGNAHEVRVGSDPGRVYNYGLIKLLQWNRGGRHFAIVSELSVDEMLRMATSVKAGQ